MKVTKPLVDLYWMATNLRFVSLPNWQCSRSVTYRYETSYSFQGFVGWSYSVWQVCSLFDRRILLPFYLDLLGWPCDLSRQTTRR
jgi:hypothetical protein